MPAIEPIRSVPALAVALRQTDSRRLPASTAAYLEQQELVPLYGVESGDETTEIDSAVHTIATIADKLRRLSAAYAEWHRFDAPAFFDLYPEQVQILLHLSERVTEVHVGFYADLLLPSFRRAEKYWSEEFFPAYQAAHPFNQRSDQRTSYGTHFLEITQPKMVAYWGRILSVMEAVRKELNGDIRFLAAAGGREERAAWYGQWPDPPAEGLDNDLLLPLSSLPTLTLSVTFPLPAHRQPGRLRRLRRMWRQKDWHRRP